MGALDVYEQYLAQGWHPLPVRPDGKIVLGRRSTGHEGVDHTASTLSRWLSRVPDANIGVRMPDGVIGIDVDQYDQKVGAETLSQLARRLGALPPTWTSTGRAAPSQIHFFRVPTGVRFASSAGADIEVIQRTHRYAVCWPSVAGVRRYRWYSPEGVAADGPPDVSDLARLPNAWLEHLRADGDAPRRSNDADWLEWLRERPPGPACVRMRMLLVRHLQRMATMPLHDAMTSATFALVNASADGHRGVLDVLEHVEEAAYAISAARGRDGDVLHELASAVAGAVAKTATSSYSTHACACPQKGTER